jgi:hypothetical protein
MLASNGEKVGRMNNVPRGKGTNHEKTTLTDLTLEALGNRTPAVWVGKQCPIPRRPQCNNQPQKSSRESENKKSIHYLRDTTSTPKWHTMTK